jgi:tol-pal system protein YbgF
MIARASLGLSGACLVALAMAGCASTPPEEDPVQIKLNDLDTRLARIERVVANQSLLDLANQGEALRNDVRAMHNDVDQLTNSLDASRKQQRDLYADLDRRMKALESRGVAGAGATAAGSGDAGSAVSGAAGDSSAPGSDDKTAYQTAFSLLKDSQYDRAIAAFQKFLVAYPNSSLADNAQYWLGEAYYVNKAFSDAQVAFQRVVDKYPQSRKRPDALLKIGYCEYELKQWDLAKETLSQAATQFSDTPAGHLAQQRLDKMATEQH